MATSSWFKEKNFDFYKCCALRSILCIYVCTSHSGVADKLIENKQESLKFLLSIVGHWETIQEWAISSWFKENVFIFMNVVVFWQLYL